MKRILAAAALAIAAAAAPLAITATALAPASAIAQGSAPTTQQVEEAIRAGNWEQADQMLAQVLRAKPNSAKAWYWMAQTKEKLGQTSKAQEALSRAKSIQPDMKFASPGAVQAMESRLARSQAPAVARAPSNSGAAIPGYASRPAVGSTGSAVVPASPAAVAAQTHSSHAWIWWLLFIAALVGGAVYYFNRRAKAQQSADQERDRKALLGRANDLFERASALVKTAKFEGQEGSRFGAASIQAQSKASGVLSRLNHVGASFSAYAEREALDDLEGTVGALESQKARSAWDEEPAPAPKAAPAPDAGLSSFQSPQQGQGYAPGYGGGYAPAPQTVVVHDNSGPGFLQTMILADAIRDGHRHDDYRERELERENRELRSQRDNGNSGGGWLSSPASAPEPSSGFDLGGGGGGSGWDNNSGGGGFDAGGGSDAGGGGWDDNN